MKTSILLVSAPFACAVAYAMPRQGYSTSHHSPTHTSSSSSKGYATPTSSAAPVEYPTPSSSGASAGSPAPSAGPPSALNPKCAPGGNFDLSAWQLQLPIGQDSPDSVSSSKLSGCGGYEDAGRKYFYTDAQSGAMVMKAPGSPDKTHCLKTSGSEHCRTEFGEQEPWSPDAGTNRLVADLKALNVHNVCIGQVFQSSNGHNKPFAELYYGADGTVKLGTAQAAEGGGGQDLQPIGSVAPGTRFTYEVRFEGGKLLARLNQDPFRTMKTYFTTKKAFFKAGNYNQDTDTTETAEVHFFKLKITH